jgi:hypothetical protein
MACTLNEHSQRCPSRVFPGLSGSYLGHDRYFKSRAFACGVDKLRRCEHQRFAHTVQVLGGYHIAAINSISSNQSGLPNAETATKVLAGAAFP